MKTYSKNTCTALILGFILFQASALASPIKIPLFSATSNAFDGALDISLTVDENSDATGITYSINGADTPVELSNLASGIVIYQMSGRNVAVLSSKNFSTSAGGSLTLTYLHDGVQGTYQNFDFALGRQGQSWYPFTMNSNGIPQTFTTMYLTAKKLFGKVIGIDHINVK